MTGLQFLALLFALVAICAGLAALLRLALALPPGDGGPVSLGLYQIACLAGGAESVAETAITSLGAAGVLEVDGDLLVGRSALPPGSHAVEAAVFACASRSEAARSPRRRQLGLPGAFVSDLVRVLRPDAVRIREELRSLGLIVSSRRTKAMRLLVGPLVLVPPLLGLGRLLWSLLAGQPEGYLAAPIGIGLVIGAIVTLPEGERTWRGRRVLTRIRSENAARAAAGSSALPRSQQALGVALWGPRTLLASPLASLGVVLRRAPAASS